MEYVLGILQASWQIILDAAVFILFGFVIAALIRAFLSSESIVRYLGKNDLRSVFFAALFGVPLPLCSCGVVPTAMALRKQGASRAATVSFLITTPESSIDSIAITYALIDPLMTVFRPIAAFVTGLAAGVADIFFGTKEHPAPAEEERCAHCAGETAEPHALSERLAAGMRFAFVELLADISRWFLIGMLIAGAITFAVPDTLIEQHLGLGQGWTAMLLMLAAGLPLYVCATASTPIAAALILKGMSPGAAFVFLLAGPATNAASFAVIARMLGMRTAVIYLVSIACCAVLFGMALNELYALWAIDVRAIAGHAHEMIPVWLKWSTALPLTAAMLWAAARKRD